MINHLHGKLIKSAIDSLLGLPDKVDFDLLVINNLPDVELENWVRANYKNIIIENNSKIYGFAENVNFGIDKYGDGYNYVCLVNPDVVCYPNVLNNLTSFMDANLGSGIAAPLLFNTNDTVQYSCRRFSTPFVAFGRAIRMDLILSEKFDNYLMRDYDHNKSIEVDWVTGAFMMVRMSAIKEVGLMDADNFFLYCEDQDWCLRMWKNGWTVDYVPHAKSKHSFLRAGVKKPFSRNSFYQIRSTINLFIKYQFNLHRDT